VELGEGPIPREASLTPLDALGNVLEGTDFGRQTKVPRAQNGETLPRDFSGDIVGLSINGVPFDATPARATIQNARVSPNGVVEVPTPGTQVTAGLFTPIEIDGLGRAVAVNSEGVPLRGDGAAISGVKLDATGTLTDQGGNPVAVDEESGEAEPLESVAGQPLSESTMGRPAGGVLSTAGAAAAVATVVAMMAF